MTLRKWVAPVLTILAIGGIGAAAFLTREKWLPVVFPSRSAEKPEGGHDEHGHDHDAPEDQIKLTEQAQANLGLDQPGAVDTLTPREYWRKIVIPGVVADWPGVSDRGVTARTAGVVADIRARPGDVVKPGDVLFTLHLVGEYVQSAQTDLAKVSKDLAAAITRRDQTKKLVDAGTRPGADLIEEQNQLNRLTTQAQGFRRQLLVLGLTPEQVASAEGGDAVTEVTVSVPTPPASWFPFPVSEIVYEVQELKAVLGEQVQAGQTLCVLANHRRLFVEGRAFKSESAALAGAAERGVPIEAEFHDEVPGAWPTLPPLVIHHLSNQVDTATHTFGFYLALENSARTFTRDGKPRLAWRFRPGQHVRLLVPVEKLADEAYVLPAGAVVREGPDAFVFVRAGDVFLRRPVRVLYDDRVEAVVARDGSVSAAEYVVRTPAAAALNRAIKAAAAGGGHGHDHDHGH